MPTLGLIDDRKDLRDTVSELIELSLPDGWRYLAQAPFDKTKSYLPWIRQNDIAVLAIDWKLNETAEVLHPVDYKADSVVKAIRKSEPTFPIFVLTAFPNDSALEKYGGEVEDNVSRDDLSKDPDKYMKRMVRAGERFIETRQKELAELADLSARSASGTISATDRDRLKAIQESFCLSSFDTVDDDRGEALRELHDALKGAAALAEEFSKILNKVDGGKS